MTEIRWIKLLTDIFDNKKIKQIEVMPEGDAILIIWIKILCLAGEINDGGLVYFTKEIPYTEEMLSTQFNRPIMTVKLALSTFEKFGMIKIINDIICVSNWEKYQNVDGMERVREQTRRRVAKHRESQRLLALETASEENVTLQETLRNVEVTQQNKNKNKNKEINKENVTSSDVDFEKAWNNTVDRYPKKRREATAKQIWMNRLLAVEAEERKQLATDIYKAIALFLTNHRETHSDDEKYEYIPKFDEWLTEDCDYWLRQLEEERSKQ